MLAPSMMGSRIGRDSTLACGTALCPSRRSSALPFVITPDNRLRYKRDNSRLCTEGRGRHLVRPRRLRKAVAQGSARLTNDSDAPDGLKFESEQGATPIIQPPSPVPGGWNPTLHVLELGSATGFTKETMIPQKPPPHDNAERWRDAAYSIRHTSRCYSPLPNRPTPPYLIALRQG